MTWSALQNRILVMFDDKDCISKSAKTLQSFQKAIIILLVEANRWLVQDVKDSRKPRSDLAREPNALALTARKRAARPIKV